MSTCFALQFTGFTESSKMKFTNQTTFQTIDYCINLSFNADLGNNAFITIDNSKGGIRTNKINWLTRIPILKNNRLIYNLTLENKIP